jgi:hypothetical protein
MTETLFHTLSQEDKEAKLAAAEAKRLRKANRGK